MEDTSALLPSLLIAVAAGAGAWLLRRSWRGREQRTGLVSSIGETARHRVPRDTASWWYVFGSASLVAFILQVVTGICLALVYAPSANDAWSSLIALDYDVAATTDFDWDGDGDIDGQDLKRGLDLLQAGYENGAAAFEALLGAQSNAAALNGFWPSRCENCVRNRSCSLTSVSRLI